MYYLYPTLCDDLSIFGALTKSIKKIRNARFAFSVCSDFSWKWSIVLLIGRNCPSIEKEIENIGKESDATRHCIYIVLTVLRTPNCEQQRWASNLNTHTQCGCVFHLSGHSNNNEFMELLWFWMLLRLWVAHIAAYAPLRRIEWASKNTIEWPGRPCLSFGRRMRCGDKCTQLLVYALNSTQQLGPQNGAAAIIIFISFI